MATPAGPAVVASDVSIRYRTAQRSTYLAVRGVSFVLAPGEILAVIGESGSGKSTLAATIAGYRAEGAHPEICGGSLLVQGIQVRRLRNRRRDRLTLTVGYLRQDGAERLDPFLSVAENVAQPIYQRDRKFSQREAGAAVAMLMDSVRLPLSAMDKMPHELSSGQRQRVALARALILEPTLLVADEPTIGVDATVRDSVLDSITELRQERAFSALIVTSELSVAQRLTCRVMVMQAGEIVGLGPMDDVLRDPVNDYVKGLARARDAAR
jgi:peptide/nickel transport system ATP-binding protein